ncbi:MAG: ModD protein [Chloroflexaceae bacterium]|nr:ModD protein [Chloroflexaceae bacterium]
MTLATSHSFSWSCSLTDEELERLLREDVPYFDLTTHALGIGGRPGRITFVTRHETVVCGTEEAARLLEKRGAVVSAGVGSGTALPAGALVLQAEGCARVLHEVWKVAVNLLEYLSGIATSTRAMVKAARQVNPKVQVATTRKVFPGTRSLAMKAVLAGGGVPHRLGLSETVLIFPQHRAFLGGLATCIEQLDELRRFCPEKKIAIEVETKDEAVAVAVAGFDIVQIDKMPVAELRETVAAVRAAAAGQTVCIAAAGGITPANAADYSATGVEVLVTSALYASPPADIAARILSTGPEAVP